ncbi:MAG: hypothetical protein KIC54_06575 [Clostridium sp.]|nr:hypothetical protein [Clostridium sp.]
MYEVSPAYCAQKTKTPINAKEMNEISESLEMLCKNKDKFILYKKQEFLNSGLLGEGIQHKKVDDFLGDYVAISTSGTRILLENYLTIANGKIDNKVSTHCGLTKEELEVPIIKIET